jgi:hypothetical protein
MDYLNKLEKIVLGWAKNVPHLPLSAQKWLGDNVWWIALIGAILSGIAVLVTLAALFAAISIVGTVADTYYVAGSLYPGLQIANAAVSLAFLVLNGLLLAVAVKPLQSKLKKGWVLLFTALLLEAISVIVHAVLTFSVGGFIIDILFGAIGLAIGAYFIAEIHGQFAHPAKKA